MKLPQNFFSSYMCTDNTEGQNDCSRYSVGMGKSLTLNIVRRLYLLPFYSFLNKLRLFPYV